MTLDKRCELLETGQAFEISILASGSTGNSLYLETAEKKILVDAGLSGKKIESLMQQVGKNPADLVIIRLRKALTI